MSNFRLKSMKKYISLTVLTCVDLFTTMRRKQRRTGLYSITIRLPVRLQPYIIYKNIAYIFDNYLQNVLIYG